MKIDWREQGAPGPWRPGSAGNTHRPNLFWLARQLGRLDSDQATLWRDAIAELAVGDIAAFVESVFGACDAMSLETHARLAARNAAIRGYSESVYPGLGAWAAADHVARDLKRFRQRRPVAQAENILAIEPPRLFLEIATQAIDRNLKPDSIARIIRQSD